MRVMCDIQYLQLLTSPQVWYDNGAVESSSGVWNLPQVDPDSRNQFYTSFNDSCRGGESTPFYVLNDAIYGHFRTFLNSVFLRGLPISVVHYPSQGVIGCNIDVLIGILLHNTRNASNEMRYFVDDDYVGSRLEFIECVLESGAFRGLLVKHGVMLHEMHHS